MAKKQKPTDDKSSAEVEISDALAWRVHDNAKSWIAQVDVKAAAALAIEAAVLGFAFALLTTSGTLAQLSGLSRWIVGGGIMLLFTSVVLSILVLRPRTTLREPTPNDRGYLYFGHLRHWDKADLRKVLARNTVDDDQLADQVIKMSTVAWRKHVALKWSLYFLIAGMAVIGALYLALILGLFSCELGTLSMSTQIEGTNR